MVKSEKLKKLHQELRDKLAELQAAEDEDDKAELRAEVEGLREEVAGEEEKSDGRELSKEIPGRRDDAQSEVEAPGQKQQDEDDSGEPAAREPVKLEIEQREQSSSTRRHDESSSGLHFKRGRA